MLKANMAYYFNAKNVETRLLEIKDRLTMIDAAHDMYFHNNQTFRSKIHGWLKCVRVVISQLFSIQNIIAN